MKIFKIAIILIIFFTIGCNNQVSYLDNKDSQKLTGVGIDYHDIESAAHKSVQSLLNSEYILHMDFTKPKILAISDVVNDTMQRLNMQQLTTHITSVMRKTGKFKITAAISGSGGLTDKMIQKSRNARGNEEFNQYTTIKKGNLLAPELSLSGSVIQKNTKVGTKQRIDYTFLLSLVDLKTGIVEWSDETHIIKVSNNTQVAW